VIARLLAEAKLIEKRLDQISAKPEQARQAGLEQRRFFGKWDKALDSSRTGPHWLKDARRLALQ